MSIERQTNVSTNALRTPVRSSAAANGLRAATAALLVATGALAGCNKGDNADAPSEKAVATASPSVKTAPTHNPLVPAGEEKPKTEGDEILKYLYTHKPGYMAQETGGMRAFGHFPRNSMEVVVRLKGQAQVPSENVTQVNCKVDDTEYTNFWVKSGNGGYYVMLDCDLPQVNCINLSDSLPKLSEQPTYTDADTDLQNFPSNTVFQMGQLRFNQKPGCVEFDSAAPTEPAPAPVVTSTPRPKYDLPKLVTKDELDRKFAEQAKRDEAQDAAIASKADQKKVDELAWAISCDNPKNRKVCKEAEQAMVDQATK